jgi:hypothetical protein
MMVLTLSAWAHYVDFHALAIESRKVGPTNYQATIAAAEASQSPGTY